ncbi:MAG: hypothetical protein NTX50_12795 [Candidatus Sumerlaeota bacterium]|nr:hypothetical protein [Candidatus Sumerlaeota bacterium]
MKPGGQGGSAEDELPSDPTRWKLTTRSCPTDANGMYAQNAGNLCGIQDISLKVRDARIIFPARGHGLSLSLQQVHFTLP